MPFMRSELSLSECAPKRENELDFEQSRPELLARRCAKPSWSTIHE
jgi:hypothetical protein